MAEEKRMADLSLDERMQKFQEAQQILADTIGIAVPVPHGEPMMLYDIWGQRIIEVTLLRGTEIKKEPGEKAKIAYFDRGAQMAGKEQKCGNCDGYENSACNNPDSDLYEVDTSPDDVCEEFKERSC